ncbi:uncharacterized protein FFUJ_00189 [Fusarium fujikuroi IMI 58289]|uniref:Uncharacterized protein n=1 Tax=Gibberella fujikuroi (strain CBS 195.34 / IMI 58289 / NRRL A-6831) TaxID=1279085 RepID=S0DKQ2_GIBF5|nr:uncharacterized protein FFUJ_00189 [Fusarium fujikuroi IMI 58289]CCT63189.1 uncharacterized protein FFUJ_00189 [Fusarium fujikuroi IMI 58289]SCN71604.1 uncharacterized protein FFM5_00197 [Fusarium fujikuroi]
MSREPPPWRGVHTIMEGKKAKLMLDNNEVIAETVGKLKGGGYFDSNQKPMGQWTYAKVLNRGTLLWDREISYPGDPAERSMHVHYSEESFDYGAPRPLLVGYSAHTLEPVLASINPEVFYIQEDMDGEHLGGLTLETISEGILADTKVILHHSITVPGNLRALKLLLLEKDWIRALHGGDLSVEGAKDLARQSAQSLYNGRTPFTLTRIKPATNKQIPPNKKPNIQRSVIPDEPYGPENRQLYEVLPRAHLWHNGPQDFVYKAPYISNMRYPARLYHELAHSGDKFNATAMLFAVQLWVDTSKNTPTRYSNTNDILVPCNRNSVYNVKEDAIDSARVRWYVLDAEARDPEISVAERVGLYPFMMSGSKMVYPQDIPHKFRLSETQQAMVGMPDLRALGSPSYPTEDSETIEIAMPEPIARIAFLQETSGEHTSNDFFDATGAGPTSQFGNSLRSGTIWSHEFHKYTHEPGRPIGKFITRDLTDIWTQLSDRRLRWL